MSLTIGTKKLQRMLDKAMKGVTNNNTAIITSLMGIRVEDETLCLTTTDRINFIEVYETEVKCKDFEVTVDAQRFNKLVQKINTEETILTLKDDHFEVKSKNGKLKYKLELPLEADGKIIKMLRVPDIDDKESGTISKKDIQSMLNVNKICLAKVNEDQKSHLEGYHISDNLVVSGNGLIAAINSINMFDSPFLMCRECVELLSTIDDDEINYTRGGVDGDKILFTTSDVVIYSLELEGEEIYPKDIFLKFFDDVEKESSCKLPKDELLKVLDRISLFIGEYDRRSKEENKHNITLNFTEKGLTIKSNLNTGTEIVEYGEKDNFEPFESGVCLDIFKDIINAQPRGYFTLYFGDDACLKFESDNTKHLMSLKEGGKQETKAESDDYEEDESPF